MTGKTITTKVKLLTNGKVYFHLLFDGSVQAHSNIELSGAFTEVSLTKTISPNINTIDFNFGMQHISILYVDDLIAIVQ